MTDNKEITFQANDFEFDEIKGWQDNQFMRPSMTYWQDAWRRFKKNKVAIAAFTLLLIVCLLTIVGPYFNEYGLTEANVLEKNKVPSAEHWFGTDNMGRDIWTRVWMGGRVSIAIGIAGAIINITLGLIYGGVSGYMGGVVDNIMMRIVEIISCIPKMLVIIMVSLLLSPSIPSLIFSLTISGWVSAARMIRGNVLQLKENEYVKASIALGASPWHIIKTHMFPNVMSTLVIVTTISIPGLIFSEAFLSFIGLGVQSPNTSWGALCSASQQYLLFYPYQLFFPTLAISITMLCFNLLGDGLRDALDPRMRS